MWRLSLRQIRIGLLRLQLPQRDSRCQQSEQQHSRQIQKYYKSERPLPAPCQEITQLAQPEKMKSGEGVWSSATLSPLFRLSPLCFFEKCFADHDILGATPALFLVGFSIGAWEAPGFAEVASWVRRLLAAVRPPSAARMRSITGGVPPRAPQAADPRSPPRHAPPPGPHPVHRTVPPEPLLDGMGALRS